MFSNILSYSNFGLSAVFTHSLFYQLLPHTPFPDFNDFCSTFRLSECSIFLSFSPPRWILTWLHHMLWPTRCQWMWCEQKLEMHWCSLTRSHCSCDLSQKEYASSSCWFKENVETFGVDWNTMLNLELNPGELSWVHWSYSQLTD